VAGFVFSIVNFVKELLSDGFLFWIVILRVSRFKIFKMKYFTVVPALPFYFTKNGDEDIRIPFLKFPIKIRGENFQEHLLTKYLNRPIELHPVDEKQSVLKTTVKALITDKYLLFDDVIVYAVSIPEVEKDWHGIFILKPKTTGIRQMGYRYPIEGLYFVENLNEPGKLPSIELEKLKFLEWVHLKPDHLS
jgi:hypothetical protein